MNCRELIDTLQVQLGDPHGDYHSAAHLLRQVNQALRDISSRSRSITSKISSSPSRGSINMGCRTTS